MGSSCNRSTLTHTNLIDFATVSLCIIPVECLPGNLNGGANGSGHLCIVHDQGKLIADVIHHRDHLGKIGRIT
jgi:hypothetical protein